MYKTPGIAKLLLDDGITPLFPYTRPQTKDGYFRKHEYVYDEYYDCYICPNNCILSYSTTNREGYREYKSCADDCTSCPFLNNCTASKGHVKLVTRHIWEPYMEQCEDIRYTIGSKELYNIRKETIERIFGTTKEYHGFRYTNMIGKTKMEMKVSLIDHTGSPLHCNIPEILCGQSFADCGALLFFIRTFCGILAGEIP